MNSTALPQHVPITVAYRGGHPENIHHGSMAVVNARGDLLASVGDVDSPLFTRSSLKPFQAMPLIAQAADRYGLADADVALLPQPLNVPVSSNAAATCFIEPVMGAP